MNEATATGADGEEEASKARVAFLLALATGAGLERVIWARKHLSEVYAVLTDEGDELVLKARPASPRIGRLLRFIRMSGVWVSPARSS